MSEGRARPRGEQFAQLNSELSRAVVNFASLTSSASLFGASLNVFRQFEVQIVRANAAAQGTAESLRAMSEASRQFALFTTASATDAANALFFLSQAGFDASQSLNAMTGVLVLAQATMQDVAFTSDLIASTLKTYNLASVEASRVANLFAAAQVNSLASLDKLAFAMRQVGPIANSLGQEIETTTAFLAELFNIGLRGEQAGTALRNTMVRLLKPVGEARKTLEKYNIAVVDAQGEARALDEILRDLYNANLKESELVDIFGVEALSGALAAMRAVGTGSFDEMRSAITGTNAAFDLARKQMDTVDGALKILSNSFAELQLIVGTALAPSIMAISMMFRDFVLSIRSMDEETMQLILNMGKFVVIFVAATSAFGLLRAAVMLTIGNFAAMRVAIATTIGALTALRTATTTAFAVTGISTAVSSLSTFAGALSNTATRAGAVQGALVAMRTAALNPLTLGIVAAGGIVAALILWARKSFEASQATSDAVASARSDMQGLVRDVTGFDTNTSTRQLDDNQKAIDFAQGVYGNKENSIELINAMRGARDLATKEQAAIEEAQQAMEDTSTSVAKLAEARAAFQAELERIDLDIEPENGKEFSVDEITKFVRRRYGEEFLVDILAAEAELQKYANQIGTAGGQITEANNTIRESVQSVLANLQDRQFDATLGEFGVNAETAGQLSEYIKANSEALEETIIAAFLDPDNNPTFEGLLETIAGEEGAPEALRAALAEVFERRRAQSLNVLRELMQEDADRQRDARIELLTALAGNAETQSDAERFTRQGAGLELQKEIDAILKQREEDFDKLNDSLNGMLDRSNGPEALVRTAIEVAESLEQAGFIIGQSIDMSNAAAGIAEAVANGAGADELAAMVTAVLESNAEYFDALLEQALKQFSSYEEAAIFVHGIKQQTKQTLLDAINVNVETLKSRMAGIASRFKPKKGGGGGKGKSKKDVENELDELIADIEEAFRKAQQTLIDMDPTLSVTARIQMRAEIDAQEINAKYDEQLRKLQEDFRKVEELSGGNPAKIAEATQKYGELVAQIEKAKKVELDYTNSFTAMVQRRNAAIDSQINAIRNLSMTAGNEMQRIQMGIQAGLLNYTRDLKTTVDNVANATTTVLDGLAEAVGAFATGQGDALEILRNAVLNALNTLIVDATKRMLQMMIEKMQTGFAQQGPQLAAGMAGAGAKVGAQAATGGAKGGGGFLAKIFGGGGGQAAGAGAAAGGLGETAGIQATLTQLNAQLQAIFTQFTTQLQATLTQIMAQIQAAGAAAGGGSVPGLSAIGGGGGGMNPLSFLGFFDRGGSLKNNEWGIAGENGPEIVQGPAKIVSTKDTARMIGAGASAPSVSVAAPVINNVIVQDPRVVKNYLSSSEGQKQIANIVNSRSGS